MTITANQADLRGAAPVRLRPRASPGGEGKATAAIPAMLAALREARNLPDSDPRRQAAVAEKLRVLALIDVPDA